MDFRGSAALIKLHEALVCKRSSNVHLPQVHYGIVYRYHLPGAQDVMYALLRT
jgi:hypothetical protein